MSRNFLKGEKMGSYEHPLTKDGCARPSLNFKF